MPWVYLPAQFEGAKDVWIDTAKGTDHLGKNIYEPEPKLLDTGLLDKRGTKIMKQEQRNRIGFYK